MLNVPLREFLRQAYLVPVALTIPMAIALLLLRQWLQSPGYAGLLLQVVVGGLVYGIGLLRWASRSLPNRAEARIGLARLWNQAWGREL